VVSGQRERTEARRERPATGKRGPEEDEAGETPREGSGGVNKPETAVQNILSEYLMEIPVNSRGFFSRGLTV
jgi:hypothetical protein